MNMTRSTEYIMRLLYASVRKFLHVLTLGKL